MHHRQYRDQGDQVQNLSLPPSYKTLADTMQRDEWRVHDYEKAYKDVIFACCAWGQETGRPAGPGGSLTAAVGPAAGVAEGGTDMDLEAAAGVAEGGTDMDLEAAAGVAEGGSDMDLEAAAGVAEGGS
jgi:hypothetical protein